MARDGVKNALAFMTSAYSSYSGCRQYRENIEAARLVVGEQAPNVDKIRVFYNHPDFIAANLERIRTAVETLPEAARGEFHVAYTAHSIPLSMADNCQYVKQLSETVRLLNEELGLPAERGRLVYQSRSGRPQDPWLEPDILDHLSSLAEQKVPGVVVAPIGFLSDHMEVLFDLDEEAQQLCDEKGLSMARAATVGTHPRFVSLVRELIQERMGLTTERRAIGEFGPNHDICPVSCCQYNPGRPPATAGAASGRPT
jgi:ferrochelatase